MDCAGFSEKPGHAEVKEFGIVSRPCIYFAPFVRWLSCGFLAASFLLKLATATALKVGWLPTAIFATARSCGKEVHDNGSKLDVDASHSGEIHIVIGGDAL